MNAIEPSCLCSLGTDFQKHFAFDTGSLKQAPCLQNIDTLFIGVTLYLKAPEQLSRSVTVGVEPIENSLSII